MPTSFQEYFNKIFVNKFDIFIIVYLNNILIYNNNFGQQYEKVIHYVLDQVRKYSFLPIQKSVIFTNMKFDFWSLLS